MNRLLSYNPELEFLDDGKADHHGDDEREFAADMLELEDERGIAEFLASLVAKTATGGPRLLHTALGQSLVGALEQAARRVLPIHSTSLSGPTSNALGVTSVNDLKRKAAELFGIELEGLSSEDKEFALAQQFVRFAADTIRRSTDSETRGDPSRTVEAALVQAAREHAPGLLAQHALRLPLQGRWRRSGNRIIVFDC